ncbi:hypothetical protein EGI22_01465 [Lacihabitans sp. LS3-19]|uniref:M56 family metallopeptidase n=1 Tax=Lacihabitans sp. LS3-19 TaxID=2487335 RepID=UPI0020CFC613|nr:M56 family metallopeptidase [Lacihabitans sp. LS3-19]MCP9766557.1 hypothetical protein [Lacihabitans sp. LS3-19]
MEFLLKSSACLIIFYALFYFVFKRFSFHSANRFYLIFALILSVIIPIISFEKEEIRYETAKTNFGENLMIETNSMDNLPEVQSMQKNEVSINWQQIFLAMYLLGMFIFAVMFFRKIYQIWVLTKNTKYEKLKNLKLFISDKNSINASFFNLLFINTKSLNPHEINLILAHEEAHFQKLHSLDLLFLEIYKIVFWFNPVVYFVQKSIKEIHEYEVDLRISEVHDRKEYAHLLLKLGISTNYPILHQFDKKPLSERINFIFKKPTNNMKKLYYTLLVPVVVLSIMSFSQHKTVIITKNAANKTTKEKSEIKAYPLIIKNDRNYGTWGVSKAYNFPASNISLNYITTVNNNGFNYKVNPNSFTETNISDVNKILKNRNLALIVSNKQIDFSGNISKLSVSLKHLKTKATKDFGVFDMETCRKEGENGGFFMIDVFDKNFEKSQMVTMFGSPNLLINKSNLNRKDHSIFSVNSESSIINHSADKITFQVSPDKFTELAIQEASAYLKPFGLNITLNSFTKEQNGLLDKVNITFGDVTKSFILSEMRHLIKLKDSKETPYRLDESLVFDFEIKTNEAKVSINDFWYKGAVKNKENIEILDNPKIENKGLEHPQKPIRTVYKTNFLGDNPMVVINGKEFPAEILTRLNSNAFDWSRIYLPNDKTAIEKYGEKAKDGYFEFKSSENYLITDEKQLAQTIDLIKKELAVPLARIQKIEYQDAENVNRLKIKINRVDKITTHFSIEVLKNSKVLYMIDGKPVSEEEIEDSNLSFIGGSCGEINSDDIIKETGLKGYNGYFNLITKKN